VQNAVVPDYHDRLRLFLHKKNGIIARLRAAA
jgi:hypothetical protein